ncbi:cap-specific mRNA (nucleoside-2'-O-)-methyltransferase 2 [Hylaeus volcanicus]|uniref:cap-specific mRNA (nucleoside-2'-O-)-methyltransferase 2 n=1 Tax=Hylaeus volcanicus TaxID=313075 RepID=UPI0023B835BD|nr:cap-specific mRNA (nucleoside-2'-O-)-methyltransferase 2 [Hylaeus volcanicus]
MEKDKHIFEGKQKPFTSKNSSYKKQLDNEHINNLFNKRFTIACNELYVLPEPKALFKECLWNVDKLQTLKYELNVVKNYLNNYNLSKWQLHTKQRNSAKDVMIYLKRDIQPEFLTQAWCKFYEIVSSFPLIPIDRINNSNKCFKSIHLCEAPGAFVTSLNHWLKTNVPSIQWDWIATTLNPYYEGNPSSMMIDDDRFIRHTLTHWCFGEDNTGNLMNLKNLDKLVKVSEPCSDIFLITADGSIDCLDVPAEQENVVAHLHFCETITALHLLNTGGSFLLKMFTTFECHSVCLIYLLSCCFGNVNIVKPVTSKEGNSETYVVCTDFKGPTFVSPYLETLREHYECCSEQAMFSKDDIPCAFIEKIVECSEFFKSLQCSVIMNNISTFQLCNHKMLHDIKQIQHMVASKYIRDYNVQKLISGEIIGNTILKTSSSINVRKRALQGSFSERCEQQHLTPWNQLKKLFTDSKEIEIHTSLDEDAKFKICHYPEDLHISFGKIFSKVYSSRFCCESVLNIQKGVNDILANMGCKIQYPSTESINELKKTILIKSKYKSLFFQYTDIYDSHEIIRKINNTLQNLSSGDHLILIGYSLLTHLSVGLFHLISCSFKSVKLKFCNNLGLKITLKHYNYNPKILKNLIDIETISCNAQEKGNSILEIIPVSFLYECDLFFTIVDANHWVIKSFVRYVFNELEGNIQHKE